MNLPFSIPQIEDNSDGWGPASVPDKFKDIPYYAPFNKGDKLGKAADWQQQQYQTKGGRYQKQDQGTVSTIFNWYYQDDDSTFQLVDNTKAQIKKQYGNRRYQNRSFQQKQQRGHSANWQPQQAQQRGKQQQGRKQNIGKAQYGGRWRQYDQGGANMRKREASIEVKSTWKELDTFEFNALNKIKDEEEPKAEDIVNCGFVEYYDKSYDRITSKTEKILERTDRTFFNVTTSDDPIMKQISNEQGNVFVTDTILATLMAATRSVYPWDIIVTKTESKLFFDKRDGSEFDFLTVNETATEPPVDDGRDGNINSPTSLNQEATFINQNFSQQVLTKGEKLNFEKSHPFITSEGETPASIGFKYRKWTLSEGVVLVARCDVDGVTTGKTKDLSLTIKALNEFDLKATDWRKKIDTQRGAVFATELKNNSNKLAKWCAQAVVAGNDNIKLAFVSRQSMKDPTSHVILAVQDYSTREFGTQIGLNVKHSWSIVRKIIDTCMKLQPGKYVLVKDPEKPHLRLYNVPEESFSSEKSAKQPPTTV